MSTKEWSAKIPVENMGAQKEMEVIFDISKSELLSDSLTLEDLLELIANAINTSDVFSNRKEVGSE
jgi:hypothetical protein